METEKQELTREEKEIEYLKAIGKFKKSGWTLLYERTDLESKILKDSLLVMKGKGSDKLFLAKIMVKDYSNKIEKIVIYIDRDKFRVVIDFFSNIDWNKNNIRVTEVLKWIKLKDFEKERIEHEWEADMLAYLAEHKPEMYQEALKAYMEYYQEDDIKEMDLPQLIEKIMKTCKDNLEDPYIGYSDDVFLKNELYLLLTKELSKYERAGEKYGMGSQYNKSKYS